MTESRAALPRVELLRQLLAASTSVPEPLVVIAQRAGLLSLRRRRVPPPLRELAHTLCTLELLSQDDSQEPLYRCTDKGQRYLATHAPNSAPQMPGLFVFAPAPAEPTTPKKKRVLR